jgi:hypothetical protein
MINYDWYISYKWLGVCYWFLLKSNMATGNANCVVSHTFFLYVCTIPFVLVVLQYYRKNISTSSLKKN